MEKSFYDQFDLSIAIIKHNTARHVNPERAAELKQYIIERAKKENIAVTMLSHGKIVKSSQIQEQ
jgi:hypothetical protein